jgi:SAM-dependent methyltransferase
MVAPFAREDESDDRSFYAVPRLVVHIDDGAIVAIGALYRELLPPRGRVLDLMSSWRSHLPPDLLVRLYGLGLNAVELAENSQLRGAVLAHLNRTSALPFRDACFDAAVCAVSVQYLTDPIAVFGAVRRVLRPGAPFAVTFSNRMFPTKAVALWRATGDAEHLRLVQVYFERAGFADIRAEDRSPGGRAGFWGGADPLYAVVGRRPDDG